MEVHGKRIETDEEGDIHEQVCGPCKGDNITTQATGFCKDCGELMCNACFRQHLRVQLCKDHVLVEVNLSSTPFRNVEKCKRHNGETIKFYCRKHEVVGCGDCMIPGHSACDPEYIKNLSANFQQNEDFKSLVRRIEKVTSEHKENERAIEENKRNNKTMLDGALGDIRKFRTNVNKYLDQAEADLISQVKHVMADNDKLLTKLEQDCEVLSSKIKKLKQTLDTEMYQDNALFINTMECKTNISCIEKEINKVRLVNMRQYRFVPDKQLQSINSSTKKFGTLDVTISALRRQTTQPTENKIIQKKKEPVKNDHNANREGIQITKIVVGSRVSHNGFLADQNEYTHQYEYTGLYRQFENYEHPDEEENQGSTGTVTAVHPDGSVSVWWDHGYEDGPYTIGTGIDDVTVLCTA